MLIFDELKKNDPQLRLVALMLLAGLAVLLAGLWWVQIVSAQEYQSNLETQAFRTVRLPAVRGKIMDRAGRVLAENQPRFNLVLYLDDLRKQFDAAYGVLRRQALAGQKSAIAAQEKNLGRSLTKVERKQFAFTPDRIEQMRTQARLAVAKALVAQISLELGQPITLDPVRFNRHYTTQLAMPFTLLPDLDATQVARFQEQSTNNLVAGLEMESTRFYPDTNVAAHVLGYVKKNNDSAEGEDAYFSYRLPDYVGQSGVEAEFDSQLRGHAGEESVMVNNLGYRQSDNVWTPPEPGHNLVLTVDLDIQRAAETAIARRYGPAVHAAAVVLDVRSGDVLAMASSPTFDPNDFAQGISVAAWQKIQEQMSEKNRATYENYAPGSIFKTVVALAALEAGLNPAATYEVQANPEDPGHGMIMVGRRKIRDTAPPGEYNFKRALIHSSNAYFINEGLHVGIEKIIRMGGEFHLGEETGLFPRQETPGQFPTLKRVASSGWHDGDTANLCIGQGEMAVTPIQMAVWIAAIANGGTVLWPRIVSRIEPQDSAAGEVGTNLPSGRVRDHLAVHPRSLQILRNAMLADVETSEGTGTAAAVDGMQICGKTGTAQVQDAANHFLGYNFWFASFAPYENPKYAVVVMVQGQRGSGGAICAPVAHDIYEEILKQEKSSTPQNLAAAR